jgi:WD40 repeat protein
LAVSPTAGIALNPDGTQLATLHSGGYVQLWDLIPGRELLTMVNDPVPDQGPIGLAYSPDGKRLVHASVSESPIVWDAETGQKLFTLVGHTAQVIATAWSPDNTLIATGVTILM